MSWELFKRDTHGYEVVGVDGDLLAPFEAVNGTGYLSAFVASSLRF